MGQLPPPKKTAGHPVRAKSTSSAKPMISSVLLWLTAPRTKSGRPWINTRFHNQKPTIRTVLLARRDVTKAPSERAVAGRRVRSCVVRVSPFVLHGRVLAVPRSVLVIPPGSEEVGGGEFHGLRAPMRVRRASRSPLSQ